jgi:abequosyltransferase
MDELALSICIPTNDRLEILKKTLDSIATEGDGKVGYEVVVSDNSGNGLMRDLVEGYARRGYPFCYHSSSAEGFLNSIEALAAGRGRLLKLVNNYTMFLEGSLGELIDFAEANHEEEPLSLFTNGNLRTGEIFRTYSFDAFVRHGSFYGTWSTAFSVWRSAFRAAMARQAPIEPMFPHTSLLLECSDSQTFVIDDRLLFMNQNVSSKGGYNLFRTFAVTYLDMLKKAVGAGRISVATFLSVKKSLMKEFLIQWYYNTKIARNSYTYDLSGIKESISVHYSLRAYHKMVASARTYGALKGAKDAIVSAVRRIKARGAIQG